MHQRYRKRLSFIRWPLYTSSVNTNSIHEIDALGPPPLYLRTTGDKKNWMVGRPDNEACIFDSCLPKPHPPNLWHWS